MSHREDQGTVDHESDAATVSCCLIIAVHKHFWLLYTICTKQHPKLEVESRVRVPFFRLGTCLSYPQQSTLALYCVVLYHIILLRSEDNTYVTHIHSNIPHLCWHISKIGQYEKMFVKHNSTDYENGQVIKFCFAYMPGASERTCYITYCCYLMPMT